MIKKRINTDLFIKISIMENGEAADLSTVTDLKVFVICPSTSTKKSQKYTISDNNIVIQWSSKENTTLGTYGIVVEYNRTSSSSETGYMHYVADFPNSFMIVPLSSQESNSDDIITGNILRYGIDGKSASVALGPTTIIDSGNPSVINTGDTTNAVFAFTLPKGIKGDSCTVSIGTVTTGASGTEAIVHNSGTASAAIFDFTIPKGDSLTYADLTETQIADLKKPATDAAATANTAAQAANTAATNANSATTLANQAATNANNTATSVSDATTAANNAASNATAAANTANTSATKADTATANAITATNNANTATTNANNATSSANTAASNATTATTNANTATSAANTATSNANAAATLANTNAATAETQANRAKAFADHPNKIQDGYWYIWSESDGAYINTNILAEGITPNISATVSSLSQDADPTVTKSGTDAAPSFAFGIPAGKSPVVDNVVTATGEAGTNAAVTITEDGTNTTGHPKYDYNFTIPRGATGVEVSATAPTDSTTKIWVDTTSASENYCTVDEANTLINNAVGDISTALNTINGEAV